MKKFLPVALAVLVCAICAACSTPEIVVIENSGANTSREEYIHNGGNVSYEESSTDSYGGNDDGLNEESSNEIAIYEGLWLSEVTDQFDYLEIDGDGNWELYSGGYVLDEGFLWYDPERDITYVDSALNGAIDGGRITMEGDQIYIDTCGYFDYLDGRDGHWEGSPGGSWEDPVEESSQSSEVYHADISAFEGTWYYDGDLAATTFIVIDSDGNWSFYQRAAGDPEATEVDYGYLSYSTDESGTYYAYSEVYNECWYRMYDFDTGLFLWDDDSYYRMG